jgi:tetratricopeptide (TPR) repeat protein
MSLGAANCQTGDLLAQEQVEASGKEEVLGALGKAAMRLRERLGESLSSIQKFDTPIEQATTPSLEALRAHSLGKKLQAEKGDSEALPSYKRAVELDPNFAVAYADIGEVYSNLGENRLAVQYTQKAFELRDRVSEAERFRIAAFYYAFVTGELDKENQTYELWEQSYPREVETHHNLAVNYVTFGQFDRAVQEYEYALRLDPGRALAVGNLCHLYLTLDRPDEAKLVLQDAQTRNLEHLNIHSCAHRLAFLQNDANAMQREVNWAVGRPGEEDSLLNDESAVQASHGRLTKAREFTKKAIESERRNGLKELASATLAASALREAVIGNPPQARQQVTAALATGEDVQAFAALTWAMLGDSLRAQASVDALNKQHPLDTLVQRVQLPIIRAQIEIIRGKFALAEEILGSAAPYGLGTCGGDWCLPYWNAQVHLRAGHPAAALADIRELLTHRAFLSLFSGPLAKLTLARARTAAGDAAGARTAYQDFLTLWKEADPDIPILIAAKSEYAKLQ